MNENTLSGTQSGAIKQSLPRSESSDRNRCRFRVAQAMGFRSDAGRLRDAVFRRGAVGKPVVQAENFTADVVRINVRAYGPDNAGEFMTGNRAGPLPAVRCVWLDTIATPSALRLRPGRG